MFELTTAAELARNSRVIREDDPMPYLVDSVVVVRAARAVQVTYSNGDTLIYGMSHPVIVVIP